MTEEAPDNGDEDGVNATLTSPISADGRAKPGRRYAVPARCGRAVRPDRGQEMRSAPGSARCPRR